MTALMDVLSVSATLAIRMEASITQKAANRDTWEESLSFKQERTTTPAHGMFRNDKSSERRLQCA
jgi:hypothetical protein